jgi:hypothetical protein
MHPGWSLPTLERQLVEAANRRQAVREVVRAADPFAEQPRLKDVGPRSAHLSSAQVAPPSAVEHGDYLARAVSPVLVLLE